MKNAARASRVARVLPWPTAFGRLEAPMELFSLRGVMRVKQTTTVMPFLSISNLLGSCTTLRDNGGPALRNLRRQTREWGVRLIPAWLCMHHVFAHLTLVKEMICFFFPAAMLSQCLAVTSTATTAMAELWHGLTGWTGSGLNVCHALWWNSCASFISHSWMSSQSSEPEFDLPGKAWQGQKMEKT